MLFFRNLNNLDVTSLLAMSVHQVAHGITRVLSQQTLYIGPTINQQAEPQGVCAFFTTTSTPVMESSSSRRGAIFMCCLMQGVYLGTVGLHISGCCMNLWSPSYVEAVFVDCDRERPREGEREQQPCSLHFHCLRHSWKKLLLTRLRGSNRDSLCVGRGCSMKWL